MKQYRSLYELSQSAHALFGEWLRVCGAKGVAILIYETYRTEERQAELYKIGRKPPVGLPEAPLKHWVRIPGIAAVTHALPGQSTHQERRAIDAVPWECFVESGRPASKRLDWTPFDSMEDARRFRGDLSSAHLDKRWRVLADSAAEVGISWAGHQQRFVEYVHWELPL